MPKVSKQTATLIDDFGVAEDRHEDLDGYTVNFVSIRQTHDLAPMLKALPGGNCSCPHWGYRGQGPAHRPLRRPRGDHRGRRRVLHLPPGHAPEAEAGTEIVQFSPAEELAEVQRAIKKAMQA